MKEDSKVSFQRANNNLSICFQVEQKEIIRRQEELVATVRLPAEAEAFRLQVISEGMR